MIDPAKILKNNSCRAGDALILTKPLGIGIVMAAFREGAVAGGAVEAAAGSMQRLNRYAAEKVTAINREPGAGCPVHACTDVTGFGLAAHASEMAGDKRTLVIDSASLPLLPSAAGFAENGYITSGGRRNRKFMEGRADVSALSPALGEIIFDPQTSGGLLIAVDSGAAKELCDAIRRDDPSAAIIGKVVPGKDRAVLAV
jgi:selenide,water dikinase